MSKRPIKILLIEDNIGDARLVKEMLAGSNTVRFELTHIDRLSKALESSSGESFDIILLDLSLPDSHGLDTFVQTHIVFPGAPVVVMSGLGDEDLAIKALREGAQDYLVKGHVDSDLLIHSVRYAIERKQAEAALRRAYDEMEIRVQERTAAMVKTNELLLSEIAERKQTEEALRRSEASLTGAQRIAHLGNWDWNIQTNKLIWSDEIYRIFGLTPQQFGATYDAFLNNVHPEDRAFVKKAVNEALCGRPYSIDHRIILPDGTVRIVHEQGEVIFGESGEPIRMLGIVQDITEKKENELRLIMSERLAVLGQMASGIAHEINNPLATIAACAEGLLNRMKKGRFDPELFENYLKIMEEEIIRCKGITTSMLSFVRETTYEKKDIDINYILDKTLELIGFQGRLKKVEVIKNYKEIPVVRGSEGELRQVFLAIFVNALDDMEDSGTLTFETGIEDDMIFINISNTGPGIPSELISKIFDPFFTTKSEKGGVGLGLSIARKIITNHNGNINVISEKGKSTTFKITLPK